MTIIHRLKAVAKNPHDKILNPIEDDMTTAVYAGLQAWRRELFRGINAGNVHEITSRLNDPKLRQKLRDAIADSLMVAAEAGADTARDEIERDIFGVKSMKLDIGIDWDLANSDAVQWALSKTDEILSSLTGTTMNRVGVAVADWANNGEPFQTLVTRLSSQFNERRARTIAVTEVTRAFARGNVEAARQSGVMELKRWNTAVDELVCPICGPLHRTTAPIDDTFPGDYDSPPAHPNCRCWITFTTDEAAELLREQAEEIAFLDSIDTYDSFVNIRPPEGRAPRGQGQEYKDRRTIVSKIQTQKKFRNQLQTTVNNYRGQVNQRRRITVAKARIAELDKAIEQAISISETGGDWSFKREMVEGILDYVSIITRQQ